MFKEKITELFLSVLQQMDKPLMVDKLENDTLLLESGLDSLGFAILISVLEEEFSIDPISEMDDPVYPETFGELVALYENNSTEG